MEHKKSVENLCGQRIRQQIIGRTTMCSYSKLRVIGSGINALLHNCVTAGYSDGVAFNLSATGLPRPSGKKSPQSRHIEGLNFH